MNTNKILGIKINQLSKEKILEKIKKCISQKRGFCHIVSLNPENIVVALEDDTFKKVLNEAPIKINDGFGVILAGKILNLEVGERLTGVDLMEELIDLAQKESLRMVFIGGRGNLAKSLADCYSQKYPQAKFFGFEGIKNIKKPKKSEEKMIFDIVSDIKPHFVFVAFGSPYQELWINRHKDKFKNSLVMGVGGAFDFLSGKVKRAPKIVRFLGFEWLFRLLVQPWRFKRQLRLVKFIFLVLKEKLYQLKK